MFVKHLTYKVSAASVPPLWQHLLDHLTNLRWLTRHRGRLRSSTSNLLDVCPSRCVTVGARLWNSLPADVRSASSLTTFRRKL